MKTRMQTLLRIDSRERTTLLKAHLALQVLLDNYELTQQQKTLLKLGPRLWSTESWNSFSLYVGGIGKRRGE